jgi:hypothetical protein
MRNVIAGNQAMQHQDVFIRRQYPEPLKPGIGSTEVFSMENIIAGQSAVIQQDVLILRQHPKPLESGIGQTEVFAMDGIIEKNPPLPFRSPFLFRQYPNPLESNIGKEDLPGGFRKQSIFSGQNAPFQDLAKGIIQIDGVKVLFDAKA